MNRIITSIMLGAVIICAADATHAQASGKAKADPVVRAALDTAGLKYVITPLGNFRIAYTMDDKRNHWVFVSSKTDKFNTLRTRRVWATVAKSKKALSQAVANELLMDNVMHKIGAFELSKSDGRYKISFAAKIAANSSPTYLSQAIRLVLHAADAKEKELTGADEF